MRVDLHVLDTEELLEYIKQLNGRIESIHREQARCLDIIANRIATSAEDSTVGSIPIPSSYSQDSGNAPAEDHTSSEEEDTAQEPNRIPLTSPRELTKGDRVWIVNTISHNTGDNVKDRTATVTKVNNLTKRVSFETDSGITTNRSIKYLQKIIE